MRVIVTGSRGWKKPEVVYNALSEVYLKHGSFVLIHGNCATGADAQAHHWYEMVCKVIPVGEERHDADWAERGKAAGPERNIRMVQAGADLVLGFPLGSHGGTQQTMTLARAAGIKVLQFKE